MHSWQLSAVGMMPTDLHQSGEINTIRLDKPLYPSSPNVMTTKWYGVEILKANKRIMDTAWFIFLK
jgi:hypothetical protein